MMKRIAFLLLFFVLFLGCKQINPIRNSNALDQAFPKLTHTNGIDSTFNYYGDTLREISLANYKLYYIGKYRKEIALDSGKISWGAIFIPPGFTKKDIEKYKKEKKTGFACYTLGTDKIRKSLRNGEYLKMSVQVDTTVIIGNHYPVLHRNLQKDTCVIGVGGQLSLIMEAKNPQGVWKPIQQKFQAFCSSGEEFLLLPPQEIALTFAPIFKGSYKTQMRICLGQNTSNPFWGFIDIRQFNANKE